MKRRYILVACLAAALRAQAQEMPASGFGPQQSLTTPASGAQAVYAADLDQDGDMDVLSASAYDNKIAWYENQGNGSFGEQQIITTEADGAQAVYAVDLDGDGDQDVLSASGSYFSDGKIAWYENQGDGNFGDQQIISTEADGAKDVYAADLDNDGDMDVLSASAEDNKIAWYENQGNGSFGEQQIISTAAFGARSVYAADLDQDGDMDALSASGFFYNSTIAWYENQGDGSFTDQQVISTEVYMPQAVYAADLDQDGDLDVLSASSINNKIAWYENEGDGSFGEQLVITTDGAQDVYASDLDNDGDTDILSAGGSTIARYENDGSGNFGAQQVITTEAGAAFSVYASDLDQDGDLDVLSASRYDNKIAWYENEGDGSFGEQQVITTDVYYAFSVYAADLDQDGDMDVLSASRYEGYGGKIAWYENEGSGTFGEQIVITTDVYYAFSVYAADLDQDGDQDVLSASRYDWKIAWYENEGDGNFGEQQLISTDAMDPRSVYAADLDNDGDMDVLSASSFDNKIAWYENQGDGNFGEQIVNTTEAFGAQSVYASDLDNDGDMDVLSASRNDHKIAWYENDGSGTFGEQLVITTDASYAFSVYAADLDQDGDRDVLSASAGDDKIAWYENLMGEEAMPTIESFTLVNADTDQDIAALSDGEVINLQALGHPRLTVRANTLPATVESVKLEIKGPITYRQVERNSPYALFGDYPDEQADYIGLTWLVGDYELKATPYLQGKAGIALKISFQVIKSSTTEPAFSVEVYPVPTTGVVNILHEGTGQQAQMMLLDEQGEVLLSQALKGQDQLDLASFRKGMYYLKVVNQEAVMVKRVVLE